MPIIFRKHLQTDEKGPQLKQMSKKKSNNPIEKWAKFTEKLIQIAPKHTAFDLAISIPGIYPRGELAKSNVHTRIFIIGFFLLLL